MRWSILGTSGLGLVIFASNAMAQSAVPNQAEETDRGLIVIRMAESLIRPLATAEIELETPVREVVLGVPGHGQASTVATLWLDLKPQPQQGHFLVHFRGTTTANTVGTKRSAVLTSVATTHFWATKRVVLVPGKGVRTEPATISARTATQLRGVRSTRRGLAGRLVQRIAVRRFAKLHGTINRIALAKAKQRIGAEFERELNQRLHELNDRLATMRSLVEEPDDVGTPLSLAMRTSETAILFYLRSGDGRLQLPQVPANHDSSLFEIWIHRDRKSIVDAWMAFASQLKPLTLKSPLKLKSVDQPIAGTVGVPIKLTQVDDWLVMGMGDASIFLARLAAGR